MCAWNLSASADPFVSVIPFLHQRTSRPSGLSPGLAKEKSLEAPAGVQMAGVKGGRVVPIFSLLTASLQVSQDAGGGPEGGGPSTKHLWSSQQHPSSPAAKGCQLQPGAGSRLLMGLPWSLYVTTFLNEPFSTCPPVFDWNPD